MTFGPEIAVQRIDPVSARANDVQLASFAPCDAAPFFPFSKNDPALTFMTGDTPDALRLSVPYAFFEQRTAGDDRVAWGIWDDGRLAGCVDFRTAPDGPPSLNVLLMPQSRGRGIGTMATAAATQAIFDPELAVRPYLVDEDGKLDAIHTMIHPDNRPSLKMCADLGFVKVGELERVSPFSYRRWTHQVLVDPGLAGAWGVPRQTRKALWQRERVVSKFTIKII